MKKQINRGQRSFVVEYKSNRRQPKDAAKSIWGDADLRALSNSVVEDMPPPTLDERQEMSGQNEQSHSVSVNQPIETMPSPKYELEHAPSTRSDDTTEIATVSPRTPATRLKVKYSRRTNKQPSARGKPQSTASLENSSDVEHNELAALEIENRLLRGLLSDRLRSENKELRDMLRRFG